MCPIIGIFLSSIISYRDLATIVVQITTSLQSALYFIMKRISINQRIHMKPIMEAVAAVTRETNTRMTMASVSATRTNILVGMIMVTVTVLEMVFKRA